VFSWGLSLEEKKAEEAAIWARSFAALLKYGEEHGHYVPKSKAIYDCDLPGLGEGGSNFHYVGKLGKWLHNQRSDKKRGRLSSEREALLQQLADEGTN